MGPANKMTTKSTIELTSEKFNEIYTNEKFLRQVATAHGSYTSTQQLKHYQTCSYPTTWIVTPEQIKLAKSELERLRTEKITNLQADQLVFIAMGGDYEPRFEGDICNHRIRTTFKNKDGHTYMVEFCRNGRKEDKLNDFVCTFSIDEDWRNEQETESLRLMELRNSFDYYSPAWDAAHAAYKANDHQKYYNAFDIQHSNLEMRFSKENVLQLINETFGCTYTTLEIDEHILGCDDIICFCANESNNEDKNSNLTINYGMKTTKVYHANGKLSYYERYTYITEKLYLTGKYPNARFTNDGKYLIRVGLNAKYHDNGVMAWGLFYDEFGNIDKSKSYLSKRKDGTIITY